MLVRIDWRATYWAGRLQLSLGVPRLLQIFSGMALPRRSANFYRLVLALPVFMLAYLWLSGRAASYWHAFIPTTSRPVTPVSSTEFVTGLLWLICVSPLVFAAWEIG